MSRHRIAKKLQEHGKITDWPRAFQRHRYVLQRWHMLNSNYYDAHQFSSGHLLVFGDFQRDDRPQNARIQWDGKLFFPDGLTYLWFNVMTAQSQFWHTVRDQAEKNTLTRMTPNSLRLKKDHDTERLAIFRLHNLKPRKHKHAKKKNTLEEIFGTRDTRTYPELDNLTYHGFLSQEENRLVVDPTINVFPARTIKKDYYSWQRLEIIVDQPRLDRNILIAEAQAWITSPLDYLAPIPANHIQHVDEHKFWNAIFENHS